MPNTHTCIFICSMFVYRKYHLKAQQPCSLLTRHRSLASLGLEARCAGAASIDGASFNTVHCQACRLFRRVRSHEAGSSAL